MCAALRKRLALCGKSDTHNAKLLPVLISTPTIPCGQMASLGSSPGLLRITYFGFLLHCTHHHLRDHKNNMHVSTTSYNSSGVETTMQADKQVGYCLHLLQDKSCVLYSLLWQAWAQDTSSPSAHCLTLGSTQQPPQGWGSHALTLVNT